MLKVVKVPDIAQCLLILDEHDDKNKEHLSDGSFRLGSLVPCVNVDFEDVLEKDGKGVVTVKSSVNEREEEIATKRIRKRVAFGNGRDKSAKLIGVDGVGSDTDNGDVDVNEVRH